MNGTTKIVQALEDSNILLEGATETIINKTKKQKRGLLSMLLGTLGASLLGNLLSGKGIVRAGSKNIKEKCLWKQNGFLMSPYPLANFEIKGYHQNQCQFNGVYSRNNLPEKIKHVASVINLDEYGPVGTHWIALFCKRSEIVYLDSFGVEYVPEEIKEFIGNKNIKTNIFRVQAISSIICGYFCIGFVDFMLAGKKTD